MPFPYTAILKQGYDFTRNNFQLWVLGIFVSFASGFHFLLANLVLDRQHIVAFSLPVSAAKFWEFSHSPWMILNLVVLMFVFFVSAVCKASIIWLAQKLSENESVAAKRALSEGSKFVWPVFFLQIFLFGLFSIMASALALPVVYLVALHEIGRSVALAVLGLAIFVPASILLGFLFLYSPIIAVCYKLAARSALSIAFQLFQVKLKESLVMGAILVGIWLGFMAAIGFGIIVVSVPVAFLSLVFAKLGLSWAIYLLIFGTGFLGLCAIVVLSAGLAVFSNLVWTLAVMEMIKSEKHEEMAKILAPEAEPAA